MKLGHETPALDRAVEELLAGTEDPEEQRRILSDAANVITGLDRGAGCADRMSLHSVNCGNVCNQVVKLCKIREEDLRQPATAPEDVRDLTNFNVSEDLGQRPTVPDVAGRDIPVENKRVTISLRPMSVI